MCCWTAPGTRGVPLVQGGCPEQDSEARAGAPGTLDGLGPGRGQGGFLEQFKGGLGEAGAGSWGLSVERQGAWGLCSGPSTGLLWALEAVGLLLVALGRLGGFDPRGTYPEPCVPSKGWWCGLYQGFLGAVLLCLVFCPCLPVPTTWPEDVIPAPSPGPTPVGSLPRDQRRLAVLVSSCSEWSEGLGRGFSGFCPEAQTGFEGGFYLEGDRGAPGSAALKPVGLCLPPEGLHGVRYSTGDTTALSWGPSVWKGQSLCSKGPGGFWPWS